VIDDLGNVAADDLGIAVNLVAVIVAVVGLQRGLGPVEQILIAGAAFLVLEEGEEVGADFNGQTTLLMTPL
jgi:hypothetical protein